MLRSSSLNQDVPAASDRRLVHPLPIGVAALVIVAGSTLCWAALVAAVVFLSRL